MRDFPAVGANIDDDKQWKRTVRNVVNSILGGKLNAVFDLTLAASTTTTTFSNPTVTADSVLILEPLTASAVTARASLRQLASAGQIVLTHPSVGAGDQNFRAVLVG